MKPKRMMLMLVAVLMLAGLLSGCQAGLCGHQADPEECGVCRLEEQIQALPSPEDWLAMDPEQQNAVYTQAQEAAEGYHALTEEQQALVSNLDTLIALHETFNQQIAPAVQ